jgi:hypothetical protein
MNREAPDQEAFDGETGQTVESTIPISTDSGRVFRAEVYTSINAESDPELEDELVEGSLNAVTDPQTDQSFEPAVAVRFHDPEHRLFALVVPESLRHREFALRRQLLTELEEETAQIPDYVSNFEVVFDPERLERLKSVGTGRERGSSVEVPAPPESEEPSSEADDLLEEELADLEEEWEKVEQERDQLETRESQLDEVEARIDRERRRMDEVEDELAEERNEIEALRRELESEREEIESERQRLEAERLKLEEQNRKAETAEESSDEVTQVVTDDQFIYVEEDEEGASSEPAPESTEIIDRPVDEPIDEERPGEVRVDPIELDEVPDQFDEETADGEDGYIAIVDGRVVASCRLPEDRLGYYFDETPDFFVQQHLVADYPVVGLLVAILDEEEQSVDSYGWPLDVSDEEHRNILNRLSEETDLDVAIYDEQGELAEAFEVRAPLEQNVEWIRNRVEEQLSDPDRKVGEFAEAAETYRSEEFERLGSMRHNFDRDAFHDLETPSQVKLAAGVVGYWSGEQMFEYLVSNRSYPLELFRQLQEDVVEAALEMGIYLEEPLRELAVDLGLVTDEVDLVERLLANFAEVSVRLRANNLEPVDEWENWESLIDFAQDVGVTPDPDVLELAEASLKRARDYQETREEAESEGGGEASRADAAAKAEEFVEDPAAVDVDELVVGKRSETTGVTYFLPDEAVLDTFDDLAEMSREDLDKLLEDANGRLEAAQMLIEQFGADAIPRVMEAAEQMSAPEVTALAKFLESKADGLEAELVRAVESAGPSGTFVAARALAKIKSTTAIPTLIEAFRDSDRQLNRQGMARTLATYGKKLKPTLTSSIKKEGADEHVVTLLQYLEEEVEGMLDDLADNRSEAVQDAVQRAREQKL